MSDQGLATPSGKPCADVKEHCAARRGGRTPVPINKDQPMTNRESHRLRRRTRLTGSAVLGASAVIACNTSKVAIGEQIMAAVGQNALKRRGIGLRAFNPERASPGFTLFAPLSWQNRSVFLIDLQGEVVHTWNMPYPPGLSGYLTERGTLFYNGRTSEDSFLSRFPFKGGVVLEADWSGKVLWEVRHPDHHHHGILLRNGNVLLNCMGQVPDDIARRVRGGAAEDNMPSGQYAPRRKADAGKMYSDYLVELTPAGKTVWEWRTWEQRYRLAIGEGAGENELFLPFGAPAQEEARISAEELKAALEAEDDRRPLLLDLCLPRDLPRRTDMLTNASLHAPAALPRWIEELPRDRPIAVYCICGFQVSGAAVTELRQRGYNARALVGGITAWHAIGGTTVPLDTSTYEEAPSPLVGVRARSIASVDAD